MGMTDHERAAFERLLKIAKSDAGQSRRVASFILSWWNASSLGGFDLADLFAVDQTIAADMGTDLCLPRAAIGTVLPGRLRDRDRGGYRSLAAGDLGRKPKVNGAFRAGREYEGRGFGAPLGPHCARSTRAPRGSPPVRRRVKRVPGVACAQPHWQRA